MFAYNVTFEIFLMIIIWLANKIQLNDFFFLTKTFHYTNLFILSPQIHSNINIYIDISYNESCVCKMYFITEFQMLYAALSLAHKLFKV